MRGNSRGTKRDIQSTKMSAHIGQAKVSRRSEKSATKRIRIEQEWRSGMKTMLKRAMDCYRVIGLRGLWIFDRYRRRRTATDQLRCAYERSQHEFQRRLRSNWSERWMLNRCFRLFMHINITDDSFSNLINDRHLLYFACHWIAVFQNIKGPIVGQIDMRTIRCFVDSEQYHKFHIWVFHSAASTRAPADKRSYPISVEIWLHRELSILPRSSRCSHHCLRQTSWQSICSMGVRTEDRSSGVNVLHGWVGCFEFATGSIYDFSLISAQFSHLKLTPFHAEMQYFYRGVHV